MVLKPGEGVGGRAFAERRAVSTEDWKVDPSLRYRPETVAALEEGDSPRAFVAVPIIIRDEVFGVLLGGARPAGASLSAMSVCCPAWPRRPRWPSRTHASTW